jgi:nucleoside 2-deoxyribosyltransferase
MPSIYLAGPEVFLPNAIEVGRLKKAICRRFGFEGLFPLDNELPLGGLSKQDQAQAIYEANIGLLEQADIVVANLTPFRGPSMDVGTAFEIGYAVHAGKPVFGYANVTQDLLARVAASGARRLRDGRPVDAFDMDIENFGLFENLMIDVPIRLSGEAVVAGTVPQRQLFSDLSVFERCLSRLSARTDLATLLRRRRG